MPNDLQDWSEPSSIIAALTGVLRFSNAYTLLHTFTKGTPASTKWSFTVPAATVTLNYGALFLVLKTTGVLTHQPYCAQVHDPTVAQSPSFVSAFNLTSRTFATAGGNIYQAIVPIASVTGHVLKINVWLSSAATGQLIVYGLTSNPGVLVRPDGRTYPQGVWGATVAHKTVGAVILLTPPPTPLRALIKTVSLSGGATSAGTSFATIKAHVSGVTTPLVGGTGSTTSGVSAQLDDAAGILVVGHSGVTMVIVTAAGKTFVGSITYDVVV